MCVSSPVEFRPVLRTQFDELSKLIMRQVFHSHNQLGRTCDESIYRNDLARRLKAEKLGPVTTEVPLIVTLDDFSKKYYLDLVIQRALIVELKALEQLNYKCEAQLLNYLFLTGMPHGKLINLRPPRVEFRTVNAVVPAEARRRYVMVTDRWTPLSSRCKELADILEASLRAWGTHLDCDLYADALVHFLGGEECVLRRITLKRDGWPLGAQVVKLVTANIGFEVTGFNAKSRAGYESHLRRFLRATPLKALHWFNLYQHEHHLITLMNEP